MDIGTVVHPWRRDATGCWLDGELVLGSGGYIRRRVGLLHGRPGADRVSVRRDFLALLRIPRLVGRLACTGCLDRW